MYALEKMIVFTAPSGAGKSTVVRHLLKKIDHLAFSVSATTRAPRPGEIEGQHYYFIGIDDFRNKVEEGQFVEWEEVYPGLLYGTLKSEIDRLWNIGKVIVFDIDVKGAINLKKLYGDKCLTVFVKAPTMEILVGRLKNRNTETTEALEKRIARIREELKYENSFDRVLVNDVLSNTLRDAEQIVEIFIPEIF